MKANADSLVERALPSIALVGLAIIAPRCSTRGSYSNSVETRAESGSY